jgi:hypothetical protein
MGEKKGDSLIGRDLFREGGRAYYQGFWIYLEKKGSVQSSYYQGIIGYI